MTTPAAWLAPLVRPRASRGIKTTFEDGYDYDIRANKLTPFPVTYVVRGGTGKLFKVRILSYDASPDRGTSDVSGRFTLRVAPLDGGS